MMEKKKEKVKQQSAEVQSEGRAAVVLAYGKILPEFKQALAKFGVSFKDPKMAINERELDLMDYVSENHLRDHFPYGQRGLLPYYYVNGAIEGRLFYVGSEPGFYDAVKKTIVIDLARINDMLGVYREGDFAKANGVTREQEQKFIELQVRSVLEASLPACIVDQGDFYRQAKRQVKELIESKIGKAKRERYRGDESRKRTMDTIALGINFAAEKVVASALLKRNLKEIMQHEIPDDHMNSKESICENYNSRLSFLPNLFLNESEHAASERASYEREESLERSSSDYINFSPYPYSLSSEGIGVFFAAMMISKYKEKAPAIVLNPQLMIEKIDSLSKRDFDNYSYSEYYSPPLHLGGGQKPLVFARSKRG